jgi:hypothetical protein
MRPCIGHGTRLSVIALALGSAAIAAATSSASPPAPPAPSAPPLAPSAPSASPPAPSAPPAASPVGRLLSASVTPGELSYGAGLAVTGLLAEAGQGVGAAPLALQADPYPFRGYATVAHAATAPDGSFSFVGVRPNRNTRLRVVVEGPAAVTSPVLSVLVDPATALNARTLGPGLTRLSLRVRHTPLARSASVSAWWFLAARGTRLFRLAAVTSTRERSPDVTYASAVIDPPSKRFVYRVCLNPTWEHAMGAPATHGSCPKHDFEVPHNVG